MDGLFLRNKSVLRLAFSIYASVMTDHAPELPMNEAQWKRAMEKSDARSAKYGELLETFMDHPDCDAIISREMGWDREPDDSSDEDNEGFDDERFDVDEMNRMCEEAAGDPEIAAQVQADEDALHAMPAYARSFEWGLQVHEALKSYLEALSDDDYDPSHPLVIAYGDSLVVAAKIAGGHGLGYEDEFLCGNIVNCKKSLTAADNALAALRTLREGDVPAEVIDPLLAAGQAVRQLVATHIAEMRSRVWWDSA